MAEVHIAGSDVTIGHLLRQRCAWCGAVLVDYDLRNVMVPEGQDSRQPSAWPVGALVGVDGHVRWTVAHVDGAPLPDGACVDLDPAVTR